MKNINNSTQWKKWISRCDVHARDHAPKAPRAAGHSTRSAVDIFNTLRVFTKEPIREQEIKLECMNHYSYTPRTLYAHAAANLNSGYSKYGKVARVHYFCRITRGGRKRLPKFKFSAKFPIGLHVILQIQIKKFENDCYIMWKIILTENPSRCNLAPLLK